MSAEAGKKHAVQQSHETTLHQKRYTPIGKSFKKVDKLNKTHKEKEKDEDEELKKYEAIINHWTYSKKRIPGRKRNYLLSSC